MKEDDEDIGYKMAVLYPYFLNLIGICFVVTTLYLPSTNKFSEKLFDSGIAMLLGGSVGAGMAQKRDSKKE